MRVKRLRLEVGSIGLLFIALLASGCQGGADAQLSARPLGLEPAFDDADFPPEPPATVPGQTPTTLAAPAGPTTTLPGLGVGSEDPSILPLEQKLVSLRYFIGKVDEAFDADTRMAVMAFQKVTGMERTGRATDDVIAAIAAAKDPPAPLVPNGGATRVEIDRDRQVLFLYEANVIDVILPVSTGNNQRFCSEGWCRRAVTPTGAFAVYDKRRGWETAPLGRLYNSQYFNGGIAIHGSTSIPAQPASHGCVRIQMSAAEWFPERLTLGTPVYVVASGEPVPAPYVPTATPVSTPTTVVPDTTTPTTPATVAPAPTTTTPNLLGGLFGTPTTQP